MTWPSAGSAGGVVRDQRLRRKPRERTRPSPLYASRERAPPLKKTPSPLPWVSESEPLEKARGLRLEITLIHPSRVKTAARPSHPPLILHPVFRVEHFHSTPGPRGGDHFGPEGARTNGNAAGSTPLPSPLASAPVTAPHLRSTHLHSMHSSHI